MCFSIPTVHDLRIDEGCRTQVGANSFRRRDRLYVLLPGRVAFMNASRNMEVLQPPNESQNLDSRRDASAV
jgi:hypothetical protein